jgi:hypothetical protein
VGDRLEVSRKSWERWGDPRARDYWALATQQVQVQEWRGWVSSLPLLGSQRAAENDL